MPAMFLRASVCAATLLLAAAAAPPAPLAAVGPSAAARLAALSRVARAPIRVLMHAIAEAPPARSATRARRSASCTLEQLIGLATSQNALIQGFKDDQCGDQSDPSFPDNFVEDWLCSTSDTVPPGCNTNSLKCGFYEIRLFKAFGNLGCVFLAWA